MKKVLMFGWEFPPHISGGLGTACLGITQALQQEGCDVLFVVPRAYGDETVPVIDASSVIVDPVFQNVDETRSVAGSLTVIPVGARVTPYGNAPGGTGTREYCNPPVSVRQKGSPRLAGGWSYSFEGGYKGDLFHEVQQYQLVARQIARDHDFDIIHAHDWFTYPAAIAAHEESGKPLVVHVHSTEYDRAGENINPYVRDVELEGMRKAHRIIAVSDWTKMIIIRRYGIPASKVAVVHNGIMPHRAGSRKNTAREMEHVVTFLGRITYQKGPAYFVEAAQVVARYLPGVHFVMAGAGDLLQEMVDAIARSRMGTRFHFTGFLNGEEIDELWTRTDVYVMPSVSEPFGITPLEAMQAGVPVIVSNQSGVSEVLPHAIKVDFWDVEKLADAIVSILMHHSLSQSLRRNGKRQLRTLTWKKAARKIMRCYKAVSPVTAS